MPGSGAPVDRAVKTRAKRCFLIWFMVRKSAPGTARGIAGFGIGKLAQFQADGAAATALACCLDA
jgi:hypothetical protein